MKTIGVIANVGRDPELTYTKQLVDSIEKHGGTAVLDGGILSAPGASAFVKDEKACETFEDCDMVVCLGGDGTFLKAAKMVYKIGLPILGINIGNLGFLAEADRNGIDRAVAQLFDNDYAVEERMMLEAVIYSEGRAIAADTGLNDAVITRGAISRIVHVKTYVNDVFVDMFPGDGLIISSPT